MVTLTYFIFLNSRSAGTAFNNFAVSTAEGIKCATLSYLAESLCKSICRCSAPTLNDTRAIRSPLTQCGTIAQWQCNYKRVPIPQLSLNCLFASRENTALRRDGHFQAGSSGRQFLYFTFDNLASSFTQLTRLPLSRRGPLQLRYESCLLFSKRQSAESR